MRASGKSGIEYVMRWEYVQPAGHWKRNGTVMKAVAASGVTYEIKLRHFDWGGRRKQGFTLHLNGHPISKEEISHTGLIVEAAKTEGEPNEPRFDEVRRWNAEHRDGETREGIDRAQVQELIAGKPTKALTFDEKEAVIRLDTELYLRRTLTINGWTITEVVP